MKSIKRCTSGIANKSYSFRIGYDSLPRSKQQLLKSEMQNALSYKTIRTFYQRRNGATVISANEKEAIECILYRYGIKWDYEYESAN